MSLLAKAGTILDRMRLDRIREPRSAPSESLGYSGSPDHVYPNALRSDDLVYDPGYVHAAPFPYFVKDAYVPPAAYEDLLRHWPSEQIFDHDRTDGCRIVEFGTGDGVRLYSRELIDFWQRFAREHIVNMIRCSMFAYGAKAISKYGADLKEITLYSLNITEAFRPLRFLNIHAHHINAPFFIGTCIFFVDDAGYSERGTSLYGLREDVRLNLEGYVSLCAEHDLERRTELTVRRKVDFAPNRLLSIADSPIAFHGVDDLSGMVKGPRRMLTIQWGIRSEWLTERYGITPPDHFERRRHLPLDGPVRDILRTDLVNFLTPTAYAREEVLDAFSRLRIRGVQQLGFVDEPLIVGSP